jgi:hypothetical protein
VESAELRHELGNFLEVAQERQDAAVAGVQRRCDLASEECAKVRLEMASMQALWLTPTPTAL